MWAVNRPRQTVCDNKILHVFAEERICVYINVYVKVCVCGILNKCPPYIQNTGNKMDSGQ